MKPSKILTLFTFSFSLLTFFSCSSNGNNYDAMGVFEATEVVVSAKAQGEIIRLDVTEGDEVKTDVTLGVIDATKLNLQQQSLQDNRDAQTARILNLQEQTASIQQQISHLQQEYERFSGLLTKGAATQKQVDDICYQIAVVRKQTVALKDQLNSSNRAYDRQSLSLGAQINQVEDKISDATITAPVDGTILERYCEQGEYAIPGRALFKLANLNNMTLRAYISADQYDAIKIGQKVKVAIDGREECYEGTITWISQRAEFTPKTIQTKDERANLVYAIKISVVNDGLIKIGMYGEVIL
mgnify:CR=1 FL=1